MEKVSKRVNAIQEVKESVSLLSQLLEGYNKESCSQSNQELIKVCRTQHIKKSCCRSRAPTGTDQQVCDFRAS